VLLGLLFATSTAPAFFRGAGVIFLLAGVGLAYLGGRTRRGDSRFRRAAVALSMALVVLLVLFAIQVHGLAWALVAMLVLAGASAATRPSASKWFDAVDSESNDG
jgi:peptidoglycan/LPS O-acetylase OafA/YrhL